MLMYLRCVASTVSQVSKTADNVEKALLLRRHLVINVKISHFLFF